MSKAIAQEYISEEINTFSLSDTTIAKEFYDKAESLTDHAKYDSSNYFLEKSKEIYNNLYSTHKEHSLAEGIVRSENLIGWNLMLQGKYEISLQLLGENLLFAIENLGENNIEVARTINNVGVVNWQQGKYNQAIESYQKSLTISNELLGENNPNSSGCYNNLAIIYFDKGDLDRALEYYQKALNIKLQLSAEPRVGIAQTYNNIGNTYSKKGDSHKAIEYHQKALSIRLALFGEIHPAVAKSYSNIGAAYGIKGDFDKALENNFKSLEIGIQIYKTDHPDNAMSYNNIGMAYKYKGEFDLALEYAEKSLDMKLTLLGKFHPIVLTNYLLLGNICKELFKLEEAIENYNKALEIGTELFGSKHHFIGESYYMIASVHSLRGEFESALAYCQKSLHSLAADFYDEAIYTNPEISSINPGIDLLNTLKLKAELLGAVDSDNFENLVSSLTTYELALDVIDKMRIGYKSEGSKLFLGEKSSAFFEGAINVCMNLFKITDEKSYKEAAFIIAERSKSAVLQEALNEIQAKQFSNLPSELLEEERQLRIDLAFYDTRLQREYNKKGNKDSLLIIDYENLLFDSKIRFDNLISKYENEFPEYYNLKYHTQPISAAEIQNCIPDNTALLKYFVGENDIYIFTISRDELEIVKVNQPENLPELIREFHISILKTNTAKYINLANTLSELLVVPIIEKLESIETLIIIPHDYFHRIPFEALFTNIQIDGQNDYSKFDYLINKFTVSYHYSTSIYINSVSKKLNRQEEMAALSDKSFLGFAPVFKTDDKLKINSGSELFTAMIERDHFSELQHSKWEVETISDLFTSNNSSGSVYLFSDASEGIFKSAVQDYRIIHLATHSFINEERPQISGIVFDQSSVEENSADDGILYAGETYNLNLSADLVVLSSCESGLGKLVRGEGMMALTRGFLYSGAANIIFSLWNIPDKHTSQLMVEFYANMLTGKSYSESLRLAKLIMISSQLTNRPRSWASFVLIGPD